MPPEPRFSLYEVVRITQSSATAVAGCKGVVLGKTETADSESFYYAIWVEDDGATWCFFESELESQNRFVDPQSMWSGETVRVRVDKHGRGTIVRE